MIIALLLLQAAPEGAPVAGSIWTECVKLTAQDYARLREPMPDVADAVVAACAPLESEVERQLTDQLRQGGLDPLAAAGRASQQMPGFRRIQRDRALAIIALRRRDALPK